MLQTFYRIKKKKVQQFQFVFSLFYILAQHKHSLIDTTSVPLNMSDYLESEHKSPLKKRCSELSLLLCLQEASHVPFYMPGCFFFFSQYLLIWPESHTRKFCQRVSEICLNENWKSTQCLIRLTKGGRGKTIQGFQQWKKACICQKALREKVKENMYWVWPGWKLPSSFLSHGNSSCAQT